MSCSAILLHLETYIPDSKISIIIIFQDDEPPEICVVEGAFTLQTLTPTQPMPSIPELDIKFAELVEELDLTAPNKNAMLSLPPEKKWQIYCSRKSPMDTTDGSMLSSVPPSPEHYIDRLTDMKNVRNRFFGLIFEYSKKNSSYLLFYIY